MPRRPKALYCRRCGIQVKLGTKRRVFCSDECGDAWYKENQSANDRLNYDVRREYGVCQYCSEKATHGILCKKHREEYRKYSRGLYSRYREVQLERQAGARMMSKLGLSLKEMEELMCI